MKQLLQMYEQAQILMPTEFLGVCTQLFQELLPFDKSILIYGILELENLNITTVHLDRAPMEKLHKRLAIKEVDPALSRAKAQQETAVATCCADLVHGYPELHQHALEFNQAHVLTFCTRQSPLTAEQGLVSLYRENPAQPFTEHELALCDFFLPHIFVAYQINLRLYQASVAAGCLTLIAAHDGRLYFLESQAQALLQLEWPEWSPPLLPAVLRDILLADQTYIGKHLYASARIDRDLVFIRLSPSIYPQLSHAELKASRLVAQGRSYKEVAKELNVSPSTISNQLQSAYKKLDVGNKIELGQKLQIIFEGHFA